jgi:predicted transcriptional regulator
MSRWKKTDLRTAALIVEMKKSEGRTERQISAATGIPRSTVHTIVSGAHGWAEVAEGQLFKQYRDEQNKALEQVYRTMAAEALKKAYGKMNKASYYQLICSAGIMTDKSRLLAGESTQNVSVNTTQGITG